MQILRALFAATLFLSQQCARYVEGQAGEPANDAETQQETSMPSHVTVTSWNDMPFSGISEENGTWVGKGYAFYIFDLISSKLNFTYTIVPPRRHILGDEDNGILGLLHKKKVDLAVAFLPVLPEMRRYCTFSASLDEARLTAVMKRPQESASGSGLLAPFERTVWLLVLVSLIVVGPIIYLFATIRALLWHDPTSENYSLFSCFWFVYSSLLKQGTNIMASTDSTRILFATWWIFILILTSFYTANLTAFLTKPQFTLSISSLQDIVHKGYSWVTYKGRTIDFLLSQDNYNDLSLLNVSRHQRKGVFKYYQPSSAILQTVTTKRLFLAEAHYLQTLIFNDYVNKTRNRLEHNSRCTYVIMPGSILAISRAFGFANDSVVEKPINKMLLRLVETGIIQHRQEQELPLAEICPVDLRSTERQLRNTDLLLTYKVVVTGYSVAAILFLLEIIFGFLSSRLKDRGKGAKQKLAGKPQGRWVKNTQKRMDLTKRSPTSVYQNAENILTQREQQFVNGRNYYVVTNRDGDRRFIPTGTPSAFLFQYTA